MRFLDKLESRFGWLALPGLVTTVAILQVVTFFLFMMMQPEGRARYLEFLVLDAGLVLKGQIWRLITYIFVPTVGNVLWVIIGAMFQSWLGRGLEQAWGAFRLTLYFVGGMLAMAVGSMIFGYTATGLFLFQSLLMAFAVIYPNEEILLFFILPVKIKWIAWLNVAMTVLFVMGDPSSFWMVLFSYLNFFVTFGPGFIKERAHMAKVGNRRAQFQEASKSGAAFFHQCVVCGKTDVDDPTLEFRVNDSGDEVCSICRKR
jgi:membrane associated rhomboid family serine protease